MNPNDSPQRQLRPKISCAQCAARGLTVCEGHGGGGGGSDVKEEPQAENTHINSTPLILNAMMSASLPQPNYHHVTPKPLLFSPQSLLELRVKLDTEHCQLIFLRNTLNVEDFKLFKMHLKHCIGELEINHPDIEKQLNNTHIFATNDEIIIQSISLQVLTVLMNYLKEEQLFPPLNNQVGLKDQQIPDAQTRTNELDKTDKPTALTPFIMEPNPSGGHKA